MENNQLTKSLSKIYGLKYVLFNSFDTAQLNHGLNRTEERVLMISWNNVGATMHFLSREAGLEKGSLTSVIDSLEATGLVSRERDEEDRRSFIIKLTPSGKALAEKMDSLFGEHLDTLLGCLTVEDRLEFENAAMKFARLIPFLAS